MRKYLAGALMLAFTSALYAFTNRVHGAASHLAPTLLDRGPLVPWTAWIYASYPLLFLVAFALEEDGERIGRYLRATLALNLASNAFFLALPTTIERPPADPGAPGAALLGLVRALDEPANCFPSLHVSTSFLAASLVLRRSAVQGALALAWALAIAVATVTTKQHYAADAAAGLVLAVATDRVFLTARKTRHLGCLTTRPRPYSRRSVSIGRDSGAPARPDPPRATRPCGG